jgi:D-sedoheptulose 7-phosphate isomerase
MGSTVAPAAHVITAAMRGGGTLFLMGNGGSFADALHIAGELAKNFERERPLPDAMQERLAQISGSPELGTALQRGIRAIVLGTNPVLTSAVDNDLPARHMTFAQELYALARPGDALVAISTSGRSPNILNAVYVARALDVRVIALTGPDPRALGHHADIVIRADGTTTAGIQTSHVAQYHELCRQIEQELSIG